MCNLITSSVDLLTTLRESRFSFNIQNLVPNIETTSQQVNRNVGGE